MCCSKWWAVILAILIIVFALWESAYSKWVIVIAALILLIKLLVLHPSVASMQSASAKPMMKAKKKR